MLSKVVRRANTAGIGAIVFPRVQENARAESDVASARECAAASGNNDHFHLLEKIRLLEAQVSSERHAAFEAGRREAENKARSELQPVLERLASATSEVLTMRSDLRRRAEADVVKLALMISRRILHRQLSVDESALTAIARVAFERLARSESWRITVHPQFAAAISAAVTGAQAARVQIEPDPACAPGTLIIQSSEGTLDASIDTQLDEIGRGLTDRLDRA
jgi:flagellar assembly protein FliH